MKHFFILSLFLTLSFPGFASTRTINLSLDESTSKVVGRSAGGSGNAQQGPGIINVRGLPRTDVTAYQPHSDIIWEDLNLDGNVSLEELRTVTEEEKQQDAENESESEVESFNVSVSELAKAICQKEGAAFCNEIKNEIKQNRKARASFEVLI